MRKLFRRIAFLCGAPIVVHPNDEVFVRMNDHRLPL